jgi:hypothetical protein
MRARTFLLGAPLLAAACGDTPATSVVLDNAYAPSSGAVVYTACWQAVCFPGPVSPGSSSSPPSPTVPASPNTAYAVLAPGWDPSTGGTPTSFVVLESKTGFDVHLDNTLHIPVDDASFAGNCATGSHLAQDQADFITQRIFPGVFASLHYDAATCTTAATGLDGGP